MINLRQIAVLFGTGAAVAGVLAYPDRAVVEEPRPVAVEVSPIAPPARQPASESPVAEAKEIPSPAPAEELMIAELNARVAMAKTRLKEIARKQHSIPASVKITQEPVVDREPAAEAEPELPAFARYSDLVFTPEVSFSRVDGEGVTGNSTARLISGLNFGGGFAWRQHWSEKFHTRMGLGFSRVDFLGAPNSKAIDQRGKTFGRFGLGASYRFGERLEAGAGLGINQEVFYVATGATSIRVDQVAVPRAEASLRYDLVRLSPFRLGVGARSAYLFPASADGYAVKAGSSHRFTMHIKEESADSRLRPTGEFFYDWKKQNTNLNRKTEKELGLQIGVTWRLGP